MGDVMKIIFYIWEKPCYEVGDTIEVYVDDFGKSAVS